MKMYIFGINYLPSSPAIVNLFIVGPGQLANSKMCVLSSVFGKHHGPRYPDPVNISGQVQVSSEHPFLMVQ